MPPRSARRATPTTRSAPTAPSAASASSWRRRWRRRCRSADLLIEAVDRNGVKLEVAEQYCRDPLHLMKRQIVEQGLIGDVLRVFCLFLTEGCHIVSSLRMFLGDAVATRVGSVAMNSPIPRVNANAVRSYDTEEWNLQTMEFDSGAVAVTSYSNVYHAQALGRKARTLFQIDGTTGSVVEDDVHLTTEEQRLAGGGARHRVPDPHRDPRRRRYPGGGAPADRHRPAGGLGEPLAAVPDRRHGPGDRRGDGQPGAGGRRGPAHALRRAPGARRYRDLDGRRGIGEAGPRRGRVAADPP